MSTPTQPVTAVVRRRIKPGFEDVFEALMQEFPGRVVRQPGHMGIHVLRTEGSRDYTVFDRFATMEDRRRFTASADYARWMERLGEVSVERPKVDEIEGLAFWFTLPDHQPPSKMKMFLLTVLGVYPLSIVLVTMVRPLTPLWPPLLRELLIAILKVAALTWVVMPNLSRLFKKWLSPSQPGAGRPRQGAFCRSHRSNTIE